MCRRILALTTLTTVLLLAGCHEYDVTVEVAADGSGSRTTTLDAPRRLDDTARRLMGLDGDRWRVTGLDGSGDNEEFRYRRVQQVSDLAHWRDTGGTILRGAAEGEVRLVSEVQVEQISGTGGVRQVYRETLYWIGLTEEVAAVVAVGYADLLRTEFPDLPDSLVHEARGAMAATITLSWRELAAEEHDTTMEAELGDRFNAMMGRRLLRAGARPELVQRVVRRTADWGYFDGLQTALPGLELCGEASLRLSVTMPAPVSGGNADVVEGDTATFQLDVLQTLAGPVVLEVECEY